ncbi:MAG: EscT/YscT/HrcT family type III secretion system export apparatus protein [Verrucomicrobia bacterium]|nr:EscT/YscT/HrcT family type III secretion system export apparatus protein [Verrucomicrobiota bacterium]MBS0646288.1 EscT/YscT/HrcT family type III secretion system export apparatus protein [Verrucomicrobiota bacterium]
MSSVPSDTYLSFVLSRPLMEVWNIFLLSLGRIVPAIAITPFLGGKLLSDSQKIGLGISITLIFLPFLLVHAPAAPVEFNTSFILLMIKEALIGSLIGLLMSIPYYYTQSAGSLITHQMGAQSLQVQDPMSQTQTSPTGTLLANLLVVIFFATGGIFFLFEGLLNSFIFIPIDGFLPSGFFSLKHPLWITFLDLANFVLKMTLQLSAPALLAMLLTDLFLGVANRMAPQVQITFLLYSLKAYAAIGMLALGWWLLAKQLDVEIMSWYKIFMRLIESLAKGFF